MREIKFRQKIKRPFQPDEAFHYWGYIDGTFVLPMGKNNTESDIQQFTGLKDKNGVEIYEGDVVVFINGYKNAVAWEEERACFNVIGFYQASNDYPTMAFCEDDVFEVIGNIYENPELLEKNK